MTTAPDDELSRALAAARAHGFLGPGPIEGHLAQAEAFHRVVGDHVPAGRLLDLGSGGGVPGLPLACWLPQSSWILLDASRRRAAFLHDTVRRLGLSARVTVLHQRAEVAGRDPLLRHTCDAVVARSFAPPPVTAECGAAFLRPGGHLLVAEPPGSDPQRWPAAALADLGLELEGVVGGPDDGPTVALLRLAGEYPVGLPRRVGVPAKRPLF